MEPSKLKKLSYFSILRQCNAEFSMCVTSKNYLLANILSTKHCLSFGFVWFYGISSTVVYLIPNPVYTYISNIYDL